MTNDAHSPQTPKEALVVLPLALDDIRAEFAAERQQRAALRPANKTAVFAALAGAGVAKVSVSFDGYGDSGQIENIEARDALSAPVQLPDQTISIVAVIWGQTEPEARSMTLTEAIEHLVYDALSETHGGWELNEGAFGEFVFDVSAREIRLEYNERMTVTEFYSHTF